MATITETELQRRLRNLEAGITGGGPGSAPTAVASGSTWEYVSPVIYLAYASTVNNLSNEGVITNQSDAVDFQYSPFDSSGDLLDYRGYLFSTSIYASGDATDYVWEDISEHASSVSFTRYYTTSSELKYKIGNPTSPGLGITWTSISSSAAIPATAFWVAEQYVMNGVQSGWSIYPTNTKNSPTLALITYTKTGSNKPTLGDSTWNSDVLLAAAAFTGEPYVSVTELGYGSSVIITYDDGKLLGTYKSSGWAVPTEFIEGSLIVEDSVTATSMAASTITASEIASNTITASEIAASTLTANEIAAGTITSTEIDVSTLNVEDQNLSGTLSVSANSGAISWGKTGPSDLTNTGMYMGNEGGNPYFLVGNENRFFLFDGENDILYMTGQTVTGPAVVGASTSYVESVGDVRHDVPASVTSVKLEMVGGGGAGQGFANAYTYMQWSDPEVWYAEYGAAADGSTGGTTTIKHYNSSDVLQTTYTADGGTGGDTINHVTQNEWGSSSYPSGSNAAQHGDDYDNGGPVDPFTGTGGDGINLLTATWTNVPIYTYGGDATGLGSGGGATGCTSYAYGVWHSPYVNAYRLGEGGDDGNYTIQSSVTTNAGDYFIVSVGAGGVGGGTGDGTLASGNSRRYRCWGQSGDGSDGGARIEILTKS